MTTSRPHAASLLSVPHARAGFSLVEMLTVLGILAIVLGIVIPVVASARNAARKAATQTLMADLAGAINQFETDKRRLPGYFPHALMGAGENATRGFDEMSNLMLDLAGGIVGSGVALSNTVLEVGPSDNAAGKVKVDITLIGGQTQAASGATTPQYFRVDRKNFRAQNFSSNEPEFSDTGDRAPVNASNPHRRLPALIDSFGTPVLAWSANPRARAADPFALESSGTGDQVARFYYNANRAFFDVEKLGKLKANAKLESLLSPDVNANARIATLEALLGNPAFPDKSATTKPANPRGPIVLHSAGRPAVYLTKESRGGRTALGSSNAVRYTPGQEPITSGAFEDILYTAGN